MVDRLMGERDVDGRAGAATDGDAPSPRPHSSTDAGPFGGAPTKLADAASIRNLIERSAQSDDDDRKTREMDPKQFRTLIRREARTPPKPILAPAPPPPEPEPARPPVSIDDELDAAFSDPDVAGVTASAHEELAVRVDTSALQAELAAAASKSAPAPASKDAPASVSNDAPAAARSTVTEDAPAEARSTVTDDAPAEASSPVAEAAPEPSVLGEAALAAEPAAPRTPTPAVLPVLPSRGPSARLLVIASIVLLAIAAAIYVFALR